MQIHPHQGTFNALLKEAEFTREMLGAGATQIRQASYAKKGVYFQAFTSLATGLERIGKLCVMLDFYIDNDGGFPPFKHLKKEIGHDLVALYERSQAIASKHSISFQFLENLSSPIHRTILKILSDFAIGDRYANINLLVGAKGGEDPIAVWANDIDAILFELRVSDAKKATIRRNARVMGNMLASRATIWHLAEDGTNIRDIEIGSFKTGMFEAVAPYRQLYVLQIIRYWVELLSALGDRAMVLKKGDIPHFLEIFGWFYNEDSMLRTKKIW